MLSIKYNCLAACNFLYSELHVGRPVVILANVKYVLITLIKHSMSCYLTRKLLLYDNYVSQHGLNAETYPSAIVIKYIDITT